MLNEFKIRSAIYTLLNNYKLLNFIICAKQNCVTALLSVRLNELDYCWSSNDYKTRSIILRQHSWYIQSARILWMNDRLIDGCTNLHRHECVYMASATAVSVCPTWPFNCCRCYFVCVFAASCDDTEQPGNPSTIMRLYTSHTHMYLSTTYVPSASGNC